MATYQNILVALDIYSEYQPVLEKALAIADKPEGLRLIYVTLPQVFFEPYGAAVTPDISGEIREQATARLKDIAKQHGIPENQLYVPVGSPADEIHRVADELEAQLIVLGTHGQSGVKLLLGSTANAVLHGVSCDVLAVKV